ncbi:MAG TPA: choice-of-anchor Q domain-containing protein [Anaerolineales bacterium]|nr:choice-of-anchor Q domain-containing protein [Anaerolineales bacterium]
MKNSFKNFIQFGLVPALMVLSVISTAKPASAAGGILYVDAGASGANNGTSWTDAYTDLQSALSAATSGDEIWVAAGTYKPTTGADRTISFALKNGVAIYGGFAGTETLLSERDWEINLTILSGDLNGDDVGFTNNSENSYHVLTGGGTDSTAMLDGFTITAGYANGALLVHRRGGGMYNDGGSPTLTNLTFSGNSVSGPSTSDGGGGMYNYNNSTPILTNITFSGNSAPSGSGMFNSGSSPMLTNITFSGNSASNGGGGMFNVVSDPTLKNVTFSGNSAANGGGMYNGTSNPSLINVSFSENSVSSHGGGIYNFNSDPILTNMTSTGNSASGRGGGMYNTDNSGPFLTNTILWGNTASSEGPEIYNGHLSTPVISYSLIQGSGGSGAGWDTSLGTDGGGTLDVNPLFVNAANSDLSLQALSPAIDAGDNTAVPGGVTTDLVGNPRFKNISSVADTGNGTPPIVDLGAYEAQFFCPASSRFYVDVDATGAKSGDSWADAFPTLQDALSITSGMCAGVSEIWVAEGTYTPGASRSDTFQLLNGVAIYGGFAGTETLLSERDPSANLTILSGDLNSDDVGFTNNGENSYHVVTGGSTDSTAVLEGFTITAGNANGSSPDDQGGGLYNNAGAPTLTNVVFSANYASVGGGIYNDHSDPTLTNATVDDNQAATGGGLFNNNSSPILTNVTLSGNSASNIGGGMYNYSASNPILTNVTFSGNMAVNLAGGIHNEGSSPALYNTILWGNGTELTNDFSAPIITHSIVTGGCPSGSNCTSVLDEDPLLGPLQDNGGFTQTMALGEGSPAIDAGNDANCPATDQRGIIRSQGVHCDIGAYEYEDMTPPTILSITRADTNPTSAASVDFTVTFSKPVTGVDSSDFTLTTSGISGESISGISGSDTTYTVAVHTGSGNGTIRLDIPGHATITDLNDNGLANLPFESGETYTVNKAPTAPGVATLVSPSGAITDTKPAYTWNEVSDATYYYLWVKRPSGDAIKQWYQTGNVCNSGICSVEHPLALGAGAHTWWIQTWNSSGYGPWSSGMNFSVTLPPPPGMATPVSPNAPTTDTMPTYTWNAVSGADWYYLWVKRPSGDPIKHWYEASAICIGGTCAIEHPADLGAGAHTWWVQTWNAGGYGLWSAGMNFNVNPPGAATLVSPNSSTNDANPTYTWNAVSGAEWYYLWVNAPSGAGFVKQWFTAAAAGCPSGTDTCSVIPTTALALGAHTFWVQTWSSAGYGPWSTGQAFNVTP